MKHRTSLVLLALAPQLALAWGFDGHRKLASMMQDPLPANACLRTWFSSRQTTGLQDHACDPDRWRYPSAGTAYDPNEWPRHYLEVDWVSPPEAYPRSYSQAVAQLGANYAAKNGIVPWRVEEMYGQLVTAFASKDTTAILDKAFLLSHYVTDSFSLLHDTKTFDPNGLHSRWESDMLANTARLQGVEAAARLLFGTVGRTDPRNNIFDVVLRGNALVGTLVAADTAATSTTPGIACTVDTDCSGTDYCILGTCRVYDMTGFYNSVKDLTARRWGDALTLLSSLIWSAWADAGSPVLTGFTAGCSMATPTTELVFVGYPTAFTHPDGGAGGGAGGTGGGAATGGGAGGGAGGGGDAAGGGGGTVEPQVCSCGAAPGLALGALALLFRLGRRRAR